MLKKPVDLLALAKRQREQWGITIMTSSRLPLYKAARRSAHKHWLAIYDKELKKIKKRFPSNWDENLVSSFLSKNNYALNEYQDQIFQAAKENNIDFGSGQ